MTEVIVTRALGNRYEAGVREHFGLTPKELAALAAIACFVANVGSPMPRWELERAAASPDNQDRYTLDLATPGRLYRLGLIRLVGYKDQRSYDMTVLGVARLAQ